MTKTIGRLYAASLSVVVFFVAWAAIAAKPWVQTTITVSSTINKRLARLQAREIQMQKQALQVQRVLDKRWASYRAAVLAHSSQLTAQQQLQILSAPPGPSVSVKVVYAQQGKVATTTRTSALP